MTNITGGWGEEKWGIKGSQGIRSNIYKSRNSMSASSENMEATIRRCNDAIYIAASVEQDKGCGGVEQRTTVFHCRRLGTTISYTHF